jgi:hypothetical protein
MTYKIDEHTEFWGGKHLAQTTTQSIMEFTNLPTAAEINGAVTTWSTAQEATMPLNRNVDGTLSVTSTADLRKQLDAWPSSQNITKEAVKHDDGKADWSLVPFESLEGMVKVLEFGAQKYAGWNWTTNGGFSYTRVLRSCLRHLFAYMRGEDNDPESGLSHIHHAMCNLLFISHYIGNKEKYNKDDRQVR